MNNETDGPKARGLQILGEEEIAAIYDRPHFTYDERAHYFVLSAPEKAALQQFHTFASRIFYILQLGYFKARQQFFISASLRTGLDLFRYRLCKRAERRQLAGRAAQAGRICSQPIYVLRGL